MIGRLLVPSNSRPLSDSAAENGQRRMTRLDSRTIIPADLPQMTLDATTNIPSYMPLDVLSSRQVIPRDLPIKPLDLKSTIPSHVPLTVLHAPQAVPKDAKAPLITERTTHHPAEMPDLLEPDVITTGEVNLMAVPATVYQEEKRWVLRGASALLHGAAIAMILLASALIPSHTPTNAEIDAAARSLGDLYLPPDMKSLRMKPEPHINTPVMHVDPKEIRRIAPPEPLPGPPQPPVVTHESKEMVQPSPAPGDNPPSALPPAPTPHIADSSPRPQLEPIKPAQQSSPSSITIPRYSPGRAIRDSLGDVARSSGGSGPVAMGIQGRIPSAGGGGGQDVFNGLQMLSDPEGLDWKSYLNRVLESVRRNWYSIMPESAMMGEQGKVYITFKIMRDGSVPPDLPFLERTSGKVPLDKAALSSIRASSPFEPLPSAYSQPFIELRFVFLYNLPLSAAQ
ncbi:MAG TPA: TonB C-terminal domain-containing protein [Candidatus Acidoferrum sp.]|nr:TonB C-terminal domain-containing protein [Candidatus Acidoferrum sp.]